MLPIEPPAVSQRTMTNHFVALGETRQFSPIFLDYLQNKPTLAPFFGRYPTLENFEAQIEARAATPAYRDVLYQTLTRQYESVANHPDLSVLKEANTFTVTTGHQLNIFTGPLYVIYKLITTINLAKALRARYPQYRFVPVYWMATEDHDLAEINHFYLFGKKYEWQTSQTGAVGRMTTQDLAPLLQELPEKIGLFENAYLHHHTLAEATRCVANELFGHEGLVCVDADDRELKALFKEVMRDDLTHHSAFELVKKSSQQIEALGYKTQVNAREINFFYLDDHRRERIVREDGGYKVLNTDLSFSEAEILNLIEREPQKFSPNVILRPLYQETVLPNLAYVGGPAEVSYWMQLKDLFDHHQFPYPVVMPRNFALVVNKASAKRIQKLNLSDEALFLDEANLKRSFLDKNTEAVGLEDETMAFGQVFDRVLKKAVALDKSLEGLVLAEKQKLLKSVENLDKRLRKAQEGSQETEINQLMGLKAKLFPNGGLQERTDNYLNFALNNPDFLHQVQEIFDPFNFQFHFLTEE